MHEIHEIEERAANAWPAAVLQLVEGWRLRYNNGVTRRANSVLAHAGGRFALGDKLAVAEEFYARRGAGAMFQISPASYPTELDGELERRGYLLVAPSLVQTARLVSLPPAQHSQFRVAIGNSPDPAWLAAYAEAQQLSPGAAEERHSMLRRIGPRAAFAVLSDGDAAVAVGLGVEEHGWVGMFSIATRSPWRRRGAATAVVQELAAWGRRWGATDAYLQVEEHNQVAAALYERLGFRTRYRYHYRDQPAHEPR